MLNVAQYLRLIYDLNLVTVCFTTLQFILPLFSFFESLVFMEVLLSLVVFLNL